MKTCFHPGASSHSLLIRQMQPIFKAKLASGHGDNYKFKSLSWQQLICLLQPQYLSRTSAVLACTIQDLVQGPVRREGLMELSFHGKWRVPTDRQRFEVQGPS